MVAKPIKRKKPAPPIKQEIAHTRDGRDITRGLVYGFLPSQDEVLQSKGRGDLKLYEYVLSDPQVQSCFQQLRSAIVSCEWNVHPGGDKRLDKQASNHMEGYMTPIWDRAVSKMLFAAVYGFGFGELMYAVDEHHKYTIQSLPIRNRRRFKFWDDGSPRLLTYNNHQGEPLPERKFWYFSVGADNDDELYGRGLGHSLYWPVWLKRNGMRFWATFLEKFGQPTVVGKYAPGTTPEEQDQLLKVTEAVRIQTGVTLPEGMMLEFLEASRGGTADYQAFIDQMDKYIAKAILSQTMTTDDGSSLSQAKVHEGVAFGVVKELADLVCQSFNEGPARWMTDWNFPGAAYPEIWYDLEFSEDLNSRINRDKTLFDMGYPLQPNAIEEVYGPHYVLPDADRDAEQGGLNGIQIEKLFAALQSTAEGTVPVETTVRALAIAFPNISEEKARILLAPIREQLEEEKASETDWNAELAGAGEPESSEPEAPAIDLSEGCTPCDIKDALQLYQLTADPSDFAEFWDGLILDFAKGGKKKKCTKGYNCGGSCISRKKNCRKALPDEAKKYAGWLAKHADKKELNRRHAVATERYEKTRKARKLDEMDDALIDISVLENELGLRKELEDLRESEGAKRKKVDQHKAAVESEAQSLTDRQLESRINKARAAASKEDVSTDKGREAFLKAHGEISVLKREQQRRKEGGTRSKPESPSDRFEDASDEDLQKQEEAAQGRLVKSWEAGDAVGSARAGKELTAISDERGRREKAQAQAKQEADAKSKQETQDRADAEQAATFKGISERASQHKTAVESEAQSLTDRELESRVKKVRDTGLKADAKTDEGMEAYLKAHEEIGVLEREQQRRKEGGTRSKPEAKPQPKTDARAEESKRKKAEDATPESKAAKPPKHEKRKVKVEGTDIEVELNIDVNSPNVDADKLRIVEDAQGKIVFEGIPSTKDPYTSHLGQLSRGDLEDASSDAIASLEQVAGRTARRTNDIGPEAAKIAEGPRIKSKEEFETAVRDSVAALKKRFNEGDATDFKIHEVRSAIGDRVSRTEFNKYLLEMQIDDKVYMKDGETPWLNRETYMDGMKLPGGYYRSYLTLLD